MDLYWERTRPYHAISSVEIVALFRKASIRLDIETYSVIHCGLRNTNIYVEGCDGIKYVLRIYAPKDTWWEKEKAVAESLPKDILRPELLFVSGPSDSFENSYAIFEYISGHTLDSGVEDKTVYANIGEKLAILHNYQCYDQVGFFGEDLSIQTVLPPLFEWYKIFITDTVIGKLAVGDVERLFAFIERHHNQIAKIDKEICFVHNDFRPINIIIDESDRPFFIDWEGAMAGHIYGDIGQFLRFREQVSFESEKIFIDSYNQNANRKLDRNYYLMAKIRDLINYLQLLGGTDKPNMDKDLVRLIQEVIAM